MKKNTTKGRWAGLEQKLQKKKQKITNISKQLDERESTKTRYIPLSFKYIGNPGPLNVDLGN